MSKPRSDNEHYTYNTHNILYSLALSTRSDGELPKHSTTLFYVSLALIDH